MEAFAGLGPLVLAGSGEYTPTMAVVDRYLLELCDGRSVVLIATACAEEGDERLTWWEELGVAHFRSLGIDATPLRIRDRGDADLPANAEVIAAAGIVWFSGGSPVYLARAFAKTRSWHALEAANRSGAAVAGASGGLGVLNANVPIQTAGASVPAALGLAAPLRAIAHFDRAERYRPEFIDRILSAILPGQAAVGVDEDTALVWTEGGWQVMGRKRVVVFQPEDARLVFRSGDRVDVLPPPHRAAPPAAK